MRQAICKKKTGSFSPSYCSYCDSPESTEPDQKEPIRARIVSDGCLTAVIHCSRAHSPAPARFLLSPVKLTSESGVRSVEEVRHSNNNMEDITTDTSVTTTAYTRRVHIEGRVHIDGRVACTLMVTRTQVFFPRILPG